MHTCATWCHQPISCAFEHNKHLSRVRGGGGGGGVADLDMAEELVEKDDQAQAVHPHIVVAVIIAFFHLRGGTCLVDLMQTWDSVCNACFYHAQV